MKSKFVLVVVLVFVALTFALAGCSASSEPAASSTTDGSGTEATSTSGTSGSTDAAQLVNTKCTMCHDIGRVDSVTYDQTQWEETVDRMVSHGLVVTDEEKQQIIDYLVERDANK